MNVPDGMDAIDAREVSHGLLLALLEHSHQGSAVLPVAGLEQAMGDGDGRMWSVVIEPEGTAGTHVRINVVKIPKRE